MMRLWCMRWSPFTLSREGGGTSVCGLVPFVFGNSPISSCLWICALHFSLNEICALWWPLMTSANHRVRWECWWKVVNEIFNQITNHNPPPPTKHPTYYRKLMYCQTWFFWIRWITEALLLFSSTGKSFCIAGRTHKTDNKKTSKETIQKS